MLIAIKGLVIRFNIIGINDAKKYNPTLEEYRFRIVPKFSPNNNIILKESNRKHNLERYKS